MGETFALMMTGGKLTTDEQKDTRSVDAAGCGPFEELAIARRDRTSPRDATELSAVMLRTFASRAVRQVRARANPRAMPRARPRAR